ncbi:MAG TPA: 16S rRNA (cytidine(1402)-2'-O)-methyltransferase [Firmicutes bacterium]|uniref:Ribosomal RNA small subunit methyltransferase I n=1 Tax=Capillibacterium thermochitinicola TaxID=2699427 RepID=A0A8J6HZJ1_9FIRM|nr:16S rRNA (cytidine(1402)-2'-O)-methyltransferase [Capillibacterium thermochitinicola]MBA2132024.1 16S rRNA (cytidine(1402)-2'-O)-methyltransferase [Capillibacterium thermochitinicola]HHW12287.1 16S rRNA (cytidine(1402)-2'-O)-methyltransferase [Bacillota bacterium]
MNEEYRASNQPQGEPVAGCLYLVTTPIGNLEDLTPRAARILKEVDLIAAEDTRQTRKLLAHLGIQQRIVSYYREKEQERAALLLEYLKNGAQIAVVSDAGTPGLSDPGAVLVAKAVASGIQVVPVPGVSACLAALVASGLPTHRFVFEGFLPRKPKEKKARLAALAGEERTIVLYEAPHRLTETLELLARQLGPERPVVIARELTKKFEEFWRGTLAEAVRVWSARDVRGEFTLVLAGRSPEAEEEPEAADYECLYQEIQQRCRAGEKASAVIREIAQRDNLSRSDLYQYYQKRKGD